MSTQIRQVGDQELSTLWRVANGLAKGRRFKDVDTPEDAFARILVGRDLGITPTDSVRNITFSDGSPVIAAEVQAALLRNFVGPDGERYDYDVVTPAAKRDSECHIKIKRREGGEAGWKSRGVEIFTLDDAERAELTGNEYWKKWPRRMLFARALTAAIATYAPETVHPQLEVDPAASAFIGGDVEARDEETLAPDDPLNAESLLVAPVDDPLSIRQPQVQMLRDIYDYLEDRNELPRFLEALRIVGAPENDDVVQRVMKLDENQAAETIVRLAPRVRGELRRFKARREQEEGRARRAARERRETAGAPTA